MADRLQQLRDIGLSLQRDQVSSDSPPGAVASGAPRLPCGRLMRCGPMDGLTWEQLRKPRTVVCLQPANAESSDGSALGSSARFVPSPAPDAVLQQDCSDKAIRSWLRGILRKIGEPETTWPVLLQSEDVQYVDFFVTVMLLALGISEQMVARQYLLRRGAEDKTIKTLLKSIQKAGGALKLLSPKGLDDEPLDLEFVINKVKSAEVEGSPLPRFTEAEWLKQQVPLLMRLAKEAADDAAGNRAEEASIWHSEAVLACAELAGLSAPKEATTALAYEGHALAQLRQFRVANEVLAVCNKLLELTEGNTKVKKMVDKALSSLPADTPMVQVFETSQVAEEGIDPHYRVFLVSADASTWRCYACPDMFSWLDCGTLAASASPGVEHQAALQAMGLTTLVAVDPLGDEDLLQHYTKCVGKVAAALAATSTSCLVHCYDGFASTGIALACFFVAYGLGEPVTSEPGQPRMTGAEALEVVRALRPGSVCSPEDETLVHAFDEQAWTRHIQKGQRAFGRSTAKSTSSSTSTAAVEPAPSKPAPPGAKVVRQPGDGNCLFHSLSYSLGGTASSMRADICSFIEKNPDLEIAGTSLSEWISMLAGTSVEVYAKRMAKTGVWGTAQEIVACAHLKRVNIQVYQPKGSGFEMISDFNVTSASRTIAVLYSGGTHYDALVL